MPTTVAAPAPIPRKFLTVAEASEYTRLSVRTIKRFLRSGQLKPCRVGRRVILPVERLDRWLTGGGGAA